MEFDKNELQSFDGKDGKKTYVAANGKVWDVTESKLWKNGVHMNRHQAGTELTEAISAAPHRTEVLQKFKQVGVLKKETTGEEIPLPAFMVKFLNAYPFFKRHPHPMVVHFTMVYFITSSILLYWYYLISQMQSLLDSIYYMHILGTISLPVTISTGFVSWKINYLGKPISYIKRKIVLTFIVVFFDIVVLIAMIQQPDVLISPHGVQLIIPAFIALYLPIVSLIGHNGGQLVY